MSKQHALLGFKISCEPDTAVDGDAAAAADDAQPPFAALKNGHSVVEVRSRPTFHIRLFFLLSLRRWPLLQDLNFAGVDDGYGAVRDLKSISRS